ncbi:hypothetical protein FM120_21955 [Sphingobacterium faecium PCAi_F2.5]|nr:hypothetical protein FM120_21955 [Sphingobacterium faecium PCAi_F2.5]
MDFNQYLLLLEWISFKAHEVGSRHLTTKRTMESLAAQLLKSFFASFT